jgi:hypothetical protein
MTASVNYTQPDTFPKNLGLEFLYSVGRYAYCIADYIETDNRKSDPFIYDMEAGELRNDLLPKDEYPMMSDYLIELSAQVN